MLNERLVNAIWNRVVVPIYNDTRNGKPDLTARKICYEIGWDAAMEVFATVAKIKEWDGRIYGKNRERMNATETNPKANYKTMHGLDDIHSAHINQIIGEIIKLESEEFYR